MTATSRIFSLKGPREPTTLSPLLISTKSELLILLTRYYYEKCPEVVSEQKTVYVEIALYLINLHSVDLKAGTFHADFYLYFKGI